MISLQIIDPDFTEEYKKTGIAHARRPMHIDIKQCWFYIQSSI